METVPPLPAESQHGGEVSIILKEGVTLQQVAGGTLRMVVKDAAGVYHDCVFAMSGGGVSVRYFEGAQAVEVGVIGHFDGTRRELTLTTTQGDLTIEAVLLASAMADVVMFPEVLTDQTENALLLFKTSIQEEALVDGALEMQLVNERYGERYIYPIVYNREGDAHFLDIRDAYGDNSLFRSVNFEGTRFESLQLEKQVWTDPTLKISSPNRLMWYEGYKLHTLSTEIRQGINAINIYLTKDGSPDLVKWAVQDTNPSSYVNVETEDGIILSFDGPLSLETVLHSVSGPTEEEMPRIKIRVQDYQENGVSHPGYFPLYAARLNEYFSDSTSFYFYKFEDGQNREAVWGDSSPVIIVEL